MQKFTKLSGVVAPLNMMNVDTDMIIPKQFLKTIKREGLGQHLFDDLRFTVDGQEIAEFVLNKSVYREAAILVTGENFGCGSSREHAPWALLDFGIQCIIAPSFADIFFNNCFKNGILPVILSSEHVERLMNLAEADTTTEVSVNLMTQEIVVSTGDIISFDIDSFRKHCLLEGLDDIALTLQKTDKIDNFEHHHDRMVWS